MDCSFFPRYFFFFYYVWTILYKIYNHIYSFTQARGYIYIWNLWKINKDRMMLRVWGLRRRLSVANQIKRNLNFVWNSIDAPRLDAGKEKAHSRWTLWIKKKDHTYKQKRVYSLNRIIWIKISNITEFTDDKHSMQKYQFPHWNLKRKKKINTSKKKNYL